jgi:radical SAM protein with 4Fe4S-binding SPASM domain
MCDRGSLSRQKLDMDMELFRMVIDNASEVGVPEIKLNRFGEPLLQPNLIKMIKYSKKMGIPRVYFTTNATLLNEDITREIINSGIDSVTFSLDGGKAETYEKIRRGASYIKVVSNIERFARIRTELGKEKPKMVINTILMEDTENEITLIFKKWSSIVDKINVIPVGRYGNVADFSSIDRTSLKLERRVCHQPFDRILVFWDGTVTVCCADINGELCVGNIVNESLGHIWRNRRITEIRKMLIEKEYRKIPICEQCDLTNRVLYRKNQQARKTIYKLYG